MRAAILALGCVASTLPACSHVDQVTRQRWASGSTPLVTETKVKLSISSVATPPAEKTVKSPSDGAAAKNKSANASRTALAGTIAPEAQQDANRTGLKRSIAINVSNQGYSNANRLTEVRVAMVPHGDAFHFGNYSYAETKPGTIDLETVSGANKTSLNAGLSPTLAGAIIGSASLSAGNERSSGSSYTIKGTYRALDVDLAPDHIVVTRGGAPNMDITGVTLLKAGLVGSIDMSEVSLVVTELSVTDDNGSPLTAAKAKIKTRLETTNRTQSALVCGQVYYVERIVTSGAEYFDEDNQTIVEREGKTPARLYQLVPASEVAPPMWGIVHNGHFLEMRGPTGLHPVGFTDPKQASEFNSWLSSQRATSVGGKGLYVNKKPFAGAGQPLMVAPMNAGAGSAGAGGSCEMPPGILPEISLARPASAS
jgi:hypothetical protein